MIEKKKIRPYARLLTMLGDQLIKNEVIAVVELIKNSYDADASVVQIDLNIKDGFIVLADDGIGMTRDVIESSWLNPATPNKMRIKKSGNLKTKKGRIIQGEKGIGRFVIFKLGQKITIITKHKEDSEYRIIYDFTKYDEQFFDNENPEKDLFLDELEITLEEYKTPKHFEKGKTGTYIKIESLKSGWPLKIQRELKDNIVRLKPLVSEYMSSIKTETKNDFKCFLKIDGEPEPLQDEKHNRLDELFEKALLKIENGRFDSGLKTFYFKENEIDRKISFEDEEIKGLTVLKKYYEEKSNKNRGLECGSFNFWFYVFNLQDKELSKKEKEVVKSHRVYLYRDGIRVYPYGDPTDDWLETDKHRAVIRAGDFLSNDQIIGAVYITYKDNTKLKDKTSREGLIEEGVAVEDFKIVLKVFLEYLKKVTYRKYLDIEKRKKEQEIYKSGSIKNKLEELISGNMEIMDVKEELQEIAGLYDIELKYFNKRIDTTEELAGVGLSVEITSHDILQVINQANNNILSIVDRIDSYFNNKNDLEKTLKDLYKELITVKKSIDFVKNRLKDIQSLFSSSKRRRSSIVIKDEILKIADLYSKVMNKYKIKYEIIERGSQIKVKTTDAVILQLFINLFDNAVYWLNTSVNEEKKIEIFMDGDSNQVIFSDNGPGVSKNDAPYIFESFYSSKGEDGRGLGLYIARQLLERHGFSIELASLNKEKKLRGANFVINF